MKIALAFLDRLEGAPPLGIAYIASYIRKYGGFNDIIIIDKEDPIKAVKRNNPDIVGITSITKTFNQAIATAEKIKSDSDIATIIGGVHITELPRTLPVCFDVGVLGEGEQTMLELVQTYEKYGEFRNNLLKKIKGLAFHNNNHVFVTEQRPFIEPIDKIPYPARDLLKMKEFYLKPGRTVPDKVCIGTTMMTSRGCPYNCVYCASPQFWRRITRFHSAEYVVGEIELLAEKYKVEAIHIWDDLFATNIKRLEEVVKLLKEKRLNEKIDFYCYGRANLMTPQMCKLLKEMNVRYISFGLESGSEKILNYLKKGTVSAEQNKKAVELCKKFGFIIEGTFIFGSPDENKDDIQKSLELMKNKALDRAIACSLTPYPGTELWEYVKQRGLVKDYNEIDWERVDLRQFNEKIYMNKKMSKKEFLEQFTAIRELTNEKNARVPKIPLKYILNLKLIKRLLSDWRNFSNEIINVVKYKIFKKTAI
jgi:magnesium-protoporphyrin IX monomethyl ester (oxidative) cyclase